MSSWPKVRRYTARVLIAWIAVGCYSWQVPKRMGPEQLIAQKHPKLVRVTVQEQIELKLREPRIVWDSLYGVAAERRAPLRAGDSVAINLAHLSKFEVRRLDAIGTTAGLVGLLAGMAAIFGAIALSTMDTPSSCMSSSY